MPDISVCICTFRRPEMLRKLLQAVFAQQVEGVSVEVVVVDNDPQVSAQAVLAEMQALFGVCLQTVHSPVANISLARNAAIHTAQGQWICMVDDDECPNTDWLSRLLHTQKEFAADVVFAPVLPTYQADTPSWIIRGKYFDRPRMASGTRIDHKNARSGNVLMRRSVLDAIARNGEYFEAAFGKTGGEDSMLFRKLDAHGVCMVWCDEAPVYEEVAKDRAKASWLLQRSFRTGQIFMRTELAMLNGRMKTQRAFGLSVRAIGQFFLAVLFALACVIFSPYAAFRWARTAASQLGKLYFFRGKFLEVYGDK